jgi:5-methylcytosine-specific restriction endonuclease McrA
MPIEVECDACGATIEKPPSRVERADHHFCDKACHGDWKQGRGDNLREFSCHYCGETVERYESQIRPHSNHLFCSPQCRGKWVREKRPEVDCDQCGETIRRPPSHFEWENHFCSRECQLEWMQENATYGDDVQSGYGPGWKKQRRKALDRDNWTCQGCGRDDEELGYTPRVHHIRPFDEFDEGEWEKAHALSNLVSLCAKCHPKWEGLPLRPVVDGADVATLQD